MVENDDSGTPKAPKRVTRTLIRAFPRFHIKESATIRNDALTSG
jgi:hypothetical protein